MVRHDVLEKLLKGLELRARRRKKTRMALEFVVI